MAGAWAGPHMAPLDCHTRPCVWKANHRVYDHRGRIVGEYCQWHARETAARLARALKRARGTASTALPGRVA